MKKSLAAMAGLAMAIMLAGCGGSGSSGSSGKSSSGGKAKIPAGATIGVMNTVNGAEVTTRWAKSTTDALTGVGLKTVSGNGQGDPNVQNQLIASWIRQGVKGIILNGGFAVGPITQQLQSAKSSKIPVFAVGGARVPDPTHLLTGNYAASPAEMGKALATYLTGKYPSGTGWVFVDLPAIAAAHDVVTAGQKVLETAGWKLNGSANLEPTDFFAKTAPATVAMFRAHPETKVLFSCCDYLPGVTVPALKRANFPTALNTGTFDNLTTLDLIRKGDPVVTVATNTDLSAATAVDQLLVSLSGGTVDANADVGKYEYKVIDKTNLPAVGAYVYPPTDVLTPFIQKWKTTYGLS